MLKYQKVILVLVLGFVVYSSTLSKHLNSNLSRPSKTIHIVYDGKYISSITKWLQYTANTVDFNFIRPTSCADKERLEAVLTKGGIAAHSSIHPKRDIEQVCNVNLYTIKNRISSFLFSAVPNSKFLQSVHKDCNLTSVLDTAISKLNLRPGRNSVGGETICILEMEQVATIVME